uniref:Uncharacterized protein n=1 Tax=Talaromyces marneffei PM1 TaxID=1077442 RepID=A0A093Y367_TALMA
MCGSSGSKSTVVQLVQSSGHELECGNLSARVPTIHEAEKPDSTTPPS